MHVLLAEDEPAIRTSIADWLKDCGFSVAAAASGDEAIRLIADREPLDMLVTDINMPGADGFEVARRARLDHPGIPVLFVSGRIDLLDPSCGGSTRSRFLAKPFRLATLSRVIADMLDAPGPIGPRLHRATNGDDVRPSESAA